MQIKESAEDYLETILRLQEQTGHVRSVDIAHKLGYTKASVSIAMKKLREHGYIHIDENGTITLNKTGQDIAIKIYDRHQTLTSLLIAAGVSKETAAKDACKIEHVISTESYLCIKNYFNSKIV
ncbi:DtxR family transcriptional regulator [Anaerocolumna cellulosilytica]|uniref:DtxR family transcriptional regulator n=1 Tax=Anaerocolumna cellulosilytica TaxID=433286 RepID=A0A6S6QSC7_9FIRM|nr:metal-dependent transcriptional regulator [Anaerocolumna cellulosilytica]MBB5196155.1 Mn-dependent DtxR family transcriptional regulator [Anaerocolumna cellulosilytica]BCJ92526.1 DtxR family transcriptional regulator [Anaerocolumna cellulosilytica]